MKIVKTIGITLLSSILSSTLFASNLSFMRDSAISYFSDTDTNMMFANVKSALSHNPDGKKSTWKNPTTGAWGYAIPSHTRQQNGTTCRNVKIFNEAKDRTGVSSYVFCRIKGEWKII